MLSTGKKPGWLLTPYRVQDTPQQRSIWPEMSALLRVSARKDGVDVGVCHVSGLDHGGRKRMKRFAGRHR